MSVSELQRHVLSKKFPPLPSRPQGVGSAAAVSKNKGSSRRDYTPLSWELFFDKKVHIHVNDTNSFNVYLKGDSGPVLLLLHGGGYSGLTWACFAKRIVETIDCRVVAPDLRGHGGTVTDDEYDLSTDRQTEDINLISSKLFGEDPPPIFLVGHSMGGALAVHAASRHIFPTLIGLTVIDVVEGSAMEALQSMQNVLRSRPDRFPSQEHAIEWCVRSGQVRNLESARISMPAQIKKIHASGPANLASSLAEEPEDGEQHDAVTGAASAQQSSINDCFVWRVDLSRSEPFWDGWFRGLSAMFLNIPVPKLLLLAGVDRLDKELTVGQMRGQFQMMVLPKVGHAVHEDSPERVADDIATFMIRNKFTTAKTNDIQQVFPCC